MAPPEGLRLKRLRFPGQAGHYPGNLVLLGEERVETGQPGGKRQVQQLDAVQEQCGFGEGDVRVIALESQPAHIQRQRYRIYDAATGLIEEGWVNVADMRARGPWLEESWDFPVEVIHRQ